MIQSAIPDALLTENAIKYTHDYLGYPLYFIHFIGVAKILGSIAILIPGFNRIKEWAYAGLFFDLAGAVFSNVYMMKEFSPGILLMSVWIGFGILSYIFWNKKRKLAVHN